MGNEILKKALLSGPLPIAGTELQCAVLDDETRVLSASSIFTAFGRPRKGINSRMEITGVKIPPFLASNNLRPYLTEDILKRLKLISYDDGGKIKSGYNAELLVDMCEVYLQARRDDKLMESQFKLAVQAEILQSAFARVGIAAIVDEATGYQKVRTNDALRLLLVRYVAEGLQKWMKTFHDSFFHQLDRLYGNEKTTSRARPMYYGKFINKYIYDPLENGYIKTELDKLNITDEGKRKARFHQWLNVDGRDSLIRQISRVEARMELFPDIEEFKQAEIRQKAISVAPYLFDEMNKIID
ncbi:P63C domain-containing protein [Acinetobacter bohemicus]|uniref:p63C domain-containing protein n=2 Tax=Acinetobacter bohemicus TaxID=1435036 RepID=A0A1I6W944_9GAMM|nr:P63C domain-containing protein [Acinetobacter bohemicus]